MQQNGGKTEFAQQGFIPRGDENFIGVLRHFATQTQKTLHHCERDIGPHGDHLEIHNCADAVLFVMQHLSDASALFLRQCRQQAAHQVAGKILREVNLVVDIQRANNIEQCFVAHIFNQVIPDGFRGFDQHFAALLFLHQAPQCVALFRR
ncbi:hypothetical protein D3C75_708850 [compost metagenome]